ncbi:MAG: PDZ domain-containing protein, partial [Acidimicrobiales bacterium]
YILPRGRMVFYCRALTARRVRLRGFFFALATGGATGWGTGAPRPGRPPAAPPARTATAPATAPVMVPEDGGFERSVVRIVNFAQRGDYYSPWDVTAVRASSGSGFVIDGGVILTNAHVVSDARLLMLYVHGDPTPHKARALVLGHDCDLALVRPDEEGLLDDLPALTFGDLPALRSSVETYGYPAGGDQISSTRGVVSRIEMLVYAHSGVDRHIAIQTDAAINPGNSGGPVVQAGKVVGVAFQGASDLENVGFFIPVEVIRHFLEDNRDGRYDGYPDLSVLESNMENPAARRRAGMRDDETGVRIDYIAGGGSAAGKLLVGDILLAVDGRPIANDGSILERGLRFDYGLLVDRHQIGETVRVRALRGSDRLDLSIPLSAPPGVDRHSNLYDQAPRYFIYAGLVFVPLNVETLKTMGRDWLVNADKRLLYEHLFRPLSDPEADSTEPVALLRRLDDPVNVAIPWPRNQLVTQVNGHPIKSLRDLIEAFESGSSQYHVIELGDPGRFFVLDRQAADRASPEILKRYGIDKDRNP